MLYFRRVAIYLAGGVIGSLMASMVTAQPTQNDPVSANAHVNQLGTSVTSSGAFSYPRPPARSANIPRTRWEHRSDSVLWTRAALSALKSHAAPLANSTPEDIDTWCPSYRTGSQADRRDFWVGFLSALAKFESTYKPEAVGGGGRWYGLLQILPATARGYGCHARSGAALQNGAANLSCGLRIMTQTVLRDGVIAHKDSRWRGVSADWGPMRSASKRKDMSQWLARQTYCKPLNATRPKVRPS
ncbi:MAG: transglycosylase SLT domain-containing protein [Aliishimia sp.]